MPANFDEILSSLAEAARRLSGADLSLIALRDDPEQFRIVAAAGERGHDALGLTLSATRGATAEALRTGRPYPESGRSAPVGAHGGGAALNRLLDLESIQSMLIVPIVHEREIIGLLRVASRRDSGFTQTQIEMLELFAEQAAVAIDATRLYAEEREARAEVETLLAATESLGVQDAPEAVLRTLIEQAATRLEAERAIYAITVDGRRVIPWHWRLGEWTQDARDVSDRGITRQVWESATPYRSNTMPADPHADPKIVATFDLSSQLSVPLCSAAGDVICVVSLANSRRPEGFTERDERLLLAICETGAAILERATATAARLDAERAAARRKEEVEALLAAADQLNNAAAPDEVLSRVVGIAAELFDVSLAAVVTNEGDHVLRRCFFTGGVWRTEQVKMPLDSSIAGWVVQNGRPFRTDDVPNSPLRFPVGSGRRSPKTVLGVPIVGHEGAVLGALLLFDRNNGESFAESDERLAEGLAHYAATAFERATLIDELRRSEDHLRHLATTDSLTGLPNRADFFDRLGEALERPRPRWHSLAMLFVDLDGFKDVNDTFGHQAGDQVLRELGVRFLSFSRETDIVARVGGDEFALLLRDVDLPASALAVAERLIAMLERPFHIDGGRRISISASVGISFHSGRGNLPRAQDVAREADIALYQAKAAGRGQAVLFAPTLSTHAMDRLELQGDLQSAVARGELRLHYHPIIKLVAGDVVGYEALVRWQHPRKGLLPPAAFIPLAEETGFIRSIGRWVLAQACRQSTSWAAAKKLAQVPSLSVNLSASQFADSELVDQVRATLKSMDLRPEMLTLEVTETAVVRNPDAAIETLAALRDLGVSVAIDDFGIGYSSLSYLERLTVQTLKIDRSFIAALGHSESAVAIVRATIAMAHALGMEVLAEGVENADQLSILTDLGCDFGQGYYYAQPLPAEELAVARAGQLN